MLAMIVSKPPDAGIDGVALHPGIPGIFGR
jgi:hypothetical protein